MPDWDTIAEQFVDGTIVPFLGAGASSFSQGCPHPPSGIDLLKELAKRAEVNVECSGCKGPISDLAEIASYFARVKHSRPDLDKLIHKLIGNIQYKPNPLHFLLARVAVQRPMLIITTNYDTLLEQAFDSTKYNADYEVVATAADLLAYAGVEDELGGEETVMLSGDAGVVYRRHKNDDTFNPITPDEIQVDLAKRSLIHKVHGSVARSGWGGGYLIAEEDYVRFLGRIDQPHIFPFGIRTTLCKKTRLPLGRKAMVNSLLFLGYGLADWNIRVLLGGMGIGNGKAGEERHYAILRDINPQTKNLLEKRNFTVWENVDLERWVDEIHGALTRQGVPESRDDPDPGDDGRERK
jgi:hypothetical protein